MTTTTRKMLPATDAFGLAHIPEGGFTEVTTGEQRNSVEAFTNAKGKVQWTAKVYAEDPKDLPGLLKALTDAVEELYPGRLAGSEPDGKA